MRNDSNSESKTHYADQIVALDGKVFDGCDFQRCRMVYKGGQPPKIVGCNFSDCLWEFEGAAAQTLTFLTGLYHGGFSAVVESTFENLRANPTPQKTAETQALETKTTIAEKPGAAIIRKLAEFPPIRIRRVAKPKPQADR